MKTKSKYLFIFFFLVIESNIAIAQFLGGNADGYSQIGITNSVCSIATLNPFGGGSSDGYSQVGITNSVCSIVTLNAFGGGDSDGYSQVGITNSVCTVITLNAFGGGSADGYSQIGITNSACTVITLNAFGGGNADGYSQTGITNSVCTVATLNAFAGGDASGFASIQEIVLTPAACVALPVELIKFEVKMEDGYLLANWQTASELNNDFFTLEKTLDGINYIEVGKVGGAGNSSEILSYEMIDRNPIVGISYYRLKQTDYDGQFAYSNIRSINFNPNFAPDVSIYPNPTTGSKITIEFNQPTCIDLAIEIKDISGKIIFTSNSTIDQNQPYQMDLPFNRTNGIYFITLSCDYFSQTKKIILK